METLLKNFYERLAEFQEFAPKLVVAVLILAFAYAVGRIVGRMVATFLKQTQVSVTHKEFFRRLTIWLASSAGVFMALGHLGQGSFATGLLAGGGVTAIVLGFAFREIGENFLAGFFLAFSCPFNLGDLIESGDLRGKVMSIELRMTHIRTVDGRDIFIPNAQIFNRPLVNYTRDGLRRLTVGIGLDYGDDGQRASELILETCRKIPGVLQAPAPSAGVASFEPTFVKLELYFWINTFDPKTDITQIQTSIMEACRRALKESGFTFSSEVVSGVALEGTPRPVKLEWDRRPKAPRSKQEP